MTSHIPLVSIALPIYNAAPFLATSIGSLLEQSFRDWEMICVNDGSRDESLQILERFSSIDNRIRIINQPNRGLVAALQQAVEASRGRLIARMDADDIAMPDRLEKQVAFMQQNPEVVALGGAAIEMDVDGRPLRITRFPSDSNTLVERLLRRESALIHPSVMMCKTAMQKAGGYRSKYQWIEDHDLWLRISKLGKITNLENVVLGYRQHASSICWQRSHAQRQLMNDLLLEAYAERGLTCPAELLIDNFHTRSQAGSGKWMRMALRGGQYHTARTHFIKMWRGTDSITYKLRMTGEFVLRSPASLLRSIQDLKPDSLPDLTHWQEQISSEIIRSIKEPSQAA